MSLMGRMSWVLCQYSTRGNVVGFGEVAGPVDYSHLLKGQEVMAELQVDAKMLLVKMQEYSVQG